MSLSTFLRKRSTLSLLRFGSEMVGKLPRRGDSIPEVIAKGLAIVDTAQKVFGNRDARYRNLTDHAGLRERTSETFTRLFFKTVLHQGFVVERITVDEHLDFLEATDASGERLIFQERRYGSTPEIDPSFFHTPGFDFGGAVDQLWRNCPHGLLLTVGVGPHGYGRETTVTELAPLPSEVQTQKARARLDGVIAKHRLFAAAGVHRSYLLVGPRGTGKTSFATLFSRACGGRMVQLDASSLPLVTPQELTFLLGALRPGFLVVNDIDRAPIEATTARVLFLLEMVKASHPETTVMLTVNDASKLDSAMLRSGRVDVPVDFLPPDPEERAELVQLFAPGSDRSALQIVVATGGWTHSYVVDLCQRLTVLASTGETLDESLATVKRLWDLAEAAEGKSPGSAPGSSTPPDP